MISVDPEIMGTNVEFMVETKDVMDILTNDMLSMSDVQVFCM